MSDQDCDVGQVIVVVEAPSPSTEMNIKKGKRTATTSRQAGLEKRQCKPISWKVLNKQPSTAAFYKWIQENGDSGFKFIRKTTHTSLRGVRDYYGCTGPGCRVQYKVLFDNQCEEVVVTHNGEEHKHGEKAHSGWGLPEKIKPEVQQLYEAGITSAAEMDASLRQLGHSGFTLQQVATYMTRVRRKWRDREAVQEYSSLSVWSRGRDRSSQESRDTSCSPPPAEDFSDAPPSASPVRRPSTISRVAVPASLGPSRLASASQPQPRRQTPVMDDATVQRLVESSLAARRHSYSPYSRFPVGAALLCADGQIVAGCNVENASFGLTNCAERTAVYKAVSEGRRQFSAVAIAAEMGDKFVGPCGACRQVLAEFNAEMPVILAKPNGEIKKTSMKELLPMAFLPEEVPFKKA